MMYWRFHPSLLISLLMLMIIKIISVKAAPVVKNGQDVLNNDSRSRHERDNLDLIEKLRIYGYLTKNDHGFKGQLRSNEMANDANRKYQSVKGLNVTGKFDSETVRKMHAPRCGYDDAKDQDDPRDDDPFRPLAYTLFGTAWPRTTLYWKITIPTEKLSVRQQMTAFRRSLDMWAKVTPLKFVYSSEHPDIEIKFVKVPFDGKGGTLARGFSPGPGLGGDVDFDDAENWTIHSNWGTNLVYVAAHEFGHALGLSHSKFRDALMFKAMYSNKDPSLHPDDVEGIQHLYGGPEPTPPTWTTPTTTSATTTKEMIPPPLVPAFCRSNFRLDAISKGPDGFIYVFRERLVYKIGDTGLEHHFPKLITEVFPGAPRTHVKAVTYVPTTDKTYFFKDARLWRFTGFELDTGYPIHSTTNDLKLSSALTLTTANGVSRVFLFSHVNFWEWNTETGKTAKGYPLPSRRFCKSCPSHPDAAYMNDKGNIFFFKDNRLMTFKHRGAKAVSYPLGPSLFGPICGTDQENPELVTLEPPRFH